MEQEVRGIKLPCLRVLPKGDLWDTLVNAHTHLCHRGRDRMQVYFLEHMYHIPREVTVSFYACVLPVRLAKGESPHIK